MRVDFEVDGRHRKAKRLENRAFDVISIDCLALKFASPLKKDLLPRMQNESLVFGALEVYEVLRDLRDSRIEERGTRRRLPVWCH